MSNYPQNLLTSPIAINGDKTVPPATAIQAGSGRLSQAEGFDEWTSKPIGEGGLPPKREDFNGALYLLSQFVFWYEQGGVMRYSATTDYEPTNEVFYNGVKYRCLVANGPSSTVKGPDTNPMYWLPVDSVVRYIEQTLTAGQKAQARENIDVYSKDEIEDEYADVLRFSAQSLNGTQQKQSRTNIGVYSKSEVDDLVGDSVESAVRYTAQSLNSTQQAQARTNIGVYSKAETDTKVTTTVNNAVSGLSSAASIAMAIGSTFTTGINGSRVTIIVYASYFNNLYGRDFTKTYTCKVNSTTIGSVSLRWHSNRTGSKGHGYSAAIMQAGYLNVNRTINETDQITITEDSTDNSGGTIESQWAFVTVS